MKDYRIVRLAALHSLEAPQKLLERYPEYENNSYKEQLRYLFNDKILYSDAFSRSMQTIGHDATELVWDFELLQKKWAKESGVSFDNDNWVFDILVSQIKKIRPDVVYFQGTELAIPGRFPLISASNSLVTILKQRFPFIRLIVMFSGFPTDANRTKDVDILFSCTPAIREHYRRAGINSVICYHGFDETTLEQLDDRAETIKFSFAGSARVPERRYWALKYLLETTDVEIWTDEAKQQYTQNFLRYDVKELQKLARRELRNVVKHGMAMLGRRNLLNFGRRSWMPVSVQNVVSELVLTDREEGGTRGEIPDRTRRLPSKALQEMAPNRCHPPVVGLDYLNVLRKSKVTFNMHADRTMESVGNIRLFEATGVATCLLTDTRGNMKELFEPDQEVVTYASMEEATEKVRYLLDHDDERRQITEAGHRRTLRSHTIFTRCQLINEVIESRL